MTAARLRIASIRRVLRDRQAGTEPEEFVFRPGVNVIVGAGNTGKSLLLRSILFALADEAMPENALGDVSVRYESVAATWTVDGAPLQIERSWGNPTRAARLTANGEPASAREFSPRLLEMLRIPAVAFPRSGTSQRWADLGWAELVPHLFRDEESWMEIARGQSEIERSAVIMQFAGVAPTVFSRESGILAERLREKHRLESKKEHFETLLAEMNRELLSVDGHAGPLTVDGLARTRAALTAELARHNEQRGALVQRWQQRVMASLSEDEAARATHASEDLGPWHERRTALSTDVDLGRRRLRELAGYQRSNEEERMKLERTVEATAVLGPLRVTDCPACDQPVIRGDPRTDECFLCGQPTPDEQSQEEHGRTRVAFELARIAEEATEIGRLIRLTESNVAEATRRLGEVEGEIAARERELQPARAAAAWIAPPGLQEHDQEIGRLRERLRQLDRVGRALDVREEYARDIDALTRQIAGLQADVLARTTDTTFEQIGDRIADSMMDYIGLLAPRPKQQWGDKTISVNIAEDGVRFVVNGKPWQRALGANLRAYFLVAYQYALLNLANQEPFVHPGIALMDFPPDLSDKLDVSGAENYLLQPFIKLASRTGRDALQVVAAGRAFENLDGAHEVRLQHRF